MAKQALSNNNSKKDSKTAETWDEGAAPVAEPAPEPAPVAAPEPVVASEPAPEPVAAPVKKTRKKGQRTPLSQRLSAAPTAARKAIIIEEQLKMVQRRRAGILKLVGQDVLDNVDPSLL